jgi:hypothetical protein
VVVVVVVLLLLIFTGLSTKNYKPKTCYLQQQYQQRNCFKRKSCVEKLDSSTNAGKNYSDFYHCRPLKDEAKAIMALKTWNLMGGANMNDSE